jgi:hypothetical protein
MAIFKSTAKPDPNAPYALPAELIEAATALTAALDDRAVVDTAITKATTDRLAADEARKTAEAEVEKTDLELAICLDDAKIAGIERRVTSARMTAQTAMTAFDRATKRQTALYTLAPEKDRAIADARQGLQTAVGTFGREVSDALAIEAREAAQYLVRVLTRAHAIAATLGTMSQGVGFIGETTVLSPAPGQHAIIESHHADAADGTRIDLAKTWQNDPSAAALADLMQPIANLRRRVAGHIKFAPPPPATKPYEVSPTNRAAAAHSQAIEAREGPYKPPASTWNGHVHKFPSENRRGVELNAVAGTADQAVAELAGVAR